MPKSTKSKLKTCSFTSSAPSLGEFLKSGRVKSGMTQTEVAKAFGYSSPQFISNWERDVSQPPLSTLRKLASMYSMDPEEMFQIILSISVEQVEQNLRSRFSVKNRSK